MTLLWVLLLSAAAIAVTPLATRLLGRNAGWIVAGLLLAASVVLLIPGVDAVRGEPMTWSVSWIPSLDASFSLRLDALGLVFGLIALVIGAVVMIYSTQYLSAAKRHLNFFAPMTAFTLSMLGLVMTDDLIVLFLCWELTSFTSFLLIARSGSAGQLASMRVLFITFVGGLSLLAAVSSIIARLGTSRLSVALQSDVWAQDPGFAALVAVLVLVAAFTKSAQFPFHSWLPDAMAAATPVSAYLHAAAVVKAGIFLLMRFSPAFHEVPAWNYTLLIIGLLTTIMAALFAAQQTDLKKLLAYSTVSQLGLIVATIGIGTEMALAAALLYTIGHALFKSGLFMFVGLIDHETGTRDLGRLPALGRAMPWSFAAVTLGCLSMAGIPPMLGFVAKEEVFAAMQEAPGPAWVGWAALIAAAGGAVLTFNYCAKIVIRTFIDGERPEQDVREVTFLAYLPAALPIVVGLPLALAVPVLDTPLDAATRAMTGAALAEPVELAFWHGLTVELLATAIVVLIGLTLVRRREHLRPRLEQEFFATDGTRLVQSALHGARRAGHAIATAARADHPTRHVAAALVALSTVLLVGGLSLAVTEDLAPPVAGLNRPLDAVLAVVIAVGVLGLVRSRSRLGATVFLSAVGAGMVVQLITLGAADVGLTQLLVEALTIVVIMMVLRKMPRAFGRPRRSYKAASLALALTVGVGVALVTWVLAARRGRSDVGMFYLEQGPEITGGDNVVNTILVEFRALDTMGELAVLGIAGIAIVAIISTLPRRRFDPDIERDPPAPPLLPPPTAAWRAIEDPVSNAAPLMIMTRWLLPVLVLLSALVFWRGHNEPGGGFVAALVLAAGLALVYLARPEDGPLGPPWVPIVLIAGGVLVAVVTGLLGYVAGDFLEPMYVSVLGQSLSTSLLFDVGVYTAVLGLVIVAIDLLGGPTRGGDRRGVTEEATGESTGQSTREPAETAPQRSVRT